VLTPAGLVLVGAQPAFAVSPLCGTPITHSIVLTSNLDCSNSLGLEIAAGGITINLNGHTVNGGSGSYGYDGLTQQNSEEAYPDVTVENGTIENFRYDVNVTAARSLTLSNLKLLTDGAGDYSAAYVDNVDVGNFTNLTIGGSGAGDYPYDGLEVIDSATVRVVNSTVSRASNIGFYDKNGDHVSFSADRASGFGSSAYGFYEEYSGSISYSSDIANGDDIGFYLYCDGYGTANVTSSAANHDDYGIEPYECYGESNPPGGAFSYIGSTFNHDTANNNEYGWYSDSDNYDVTVSYGTFNYNSEDGIYSNYDFQGDFSSNTASHNDGYGMLMYEPGSETVSSNRVLNNGDTGIYLEDNYSGYDYNVVAASNNTAEYNHDYGLYADYAAPGGGNVALYNTPYDCFNFVCSPGSTIPIAP
jgi:parallel beta-helix repeat protein